MLTEDQQAIADALTLAVIARRQPAAPKPGTDPYADLAASYAEDTDGVAPRPGDHLTPKTPTDSPEDFEDTRRSPGYRTPIDESQYGFHLDGDVRYE